MRDSNVVNINYRPVDASGWPLQPAGLLGPVTLTPLRAVTPEQCQSRATDLSLPA